MITIYSKPACPQCTQTQLYCDIKGVEYTVKKLNVDFTQDEVKQLAPTARSYPVLFKDGEYFGGLKELREYFENA